MTSVENIDGSAFGIGSRLRIRQPKLKTLVWRVSEFQQGRMFSWEARSPGLCIVSSHEVDASNRGSIVKLRVMQTGLLAPVVSLLFGDLSRRYVNMEAAGLKRRCESLVYPQT